LKVQFNSPLFPNINRRIASLRVRA
jgi:hypothetical protein